MAATINLGRDFTVDGLAGVSDLDLEFSGERIDVTTRAGSKPIKQTVAGFPDMTFSCTVQATATTKFVIGKAYSLTLSIGGSMTLICLDATREEPKEGIVNYKLKLKPGIESDVENQIDIGPGNWRA